MDLHDARMANLVNGASLVHEPLEVTRLRLDIQGEDLQRRSTQNIHLLHLVHGSHTTSTKEPNHTVFATNSLADSGVWSRCCHTGITIRSSPSRC